jgi:hypothetical protein
MAKKKSLLNSAQDARSRGASSRARSANARGKAPLYDKRQANRISMWIIAIVAVLLAAYIGIQTSTDPAAAGESGLRVRALFGFRVDYRDIRELELEREPVSLGKRIFGNSAFGLFTEGEYEVQGLGHARVFLKKPNVSYLVVRTEDKDYAISLGSTDKDQLLYDRIKLGMPGGR